MVQGRSQANGKQTLKRREQAKLEAEARIMELAKNNEVERLWQAVKELEKKLEEEMERLEERVARMELREASKGKKMRQENMEKLKKSREKVARMESGNRGAEECRPSLQLEMGEWTEEARQLVLKLLGAETRIMDMALEKL